MSLVQFFRILYARRLILLAALLSSVAVAIVMVQILPKRYVATARVMLDVIKPDPLTGQMLSDRRAYTRTQIEIIRDYQTAERVVDQLGWMSNPDVVGPYLAQGVTDPVAIRRALAGNIIAGTEAEFIDASNILEISFSAGDPNSAKRVVTIIRDAYKEASVADERESAGEIADWYGEQTRQAEALVRAAEAERAEYARANGIVLQADSTDLESARLSALSTQSAIEVITPGAGPAAAPASPSQMQLDLLNQQIAQATKNLGPNHPSLQRMESQRGVLQAAVARDQASVARPASGPSPGEATRRNVAAYEAQKARVVAQSDEINMVNRMTRDIEQKRQQLAKVAEKANDFRLQANSGDNEIRVMGDAIAPTTPEFPKVPLILAGSIGFGAALGILLSLLIEFLGRRIRGREDLEYASGVPVFAEIGARAKTDKALLRKLIRYLSESTRQRRLGMAGAE